MNLCAGPLELTPQDLSKADNTSGNAASVPDTILSVLPRTPKDIPGI